MAGATELKLTLLSPRKTYLDDESVSKVTLTGSEGQIQILPDHANMVGTLETGVFRCTHQDGKLTVGCISSGFFQVDKNQVNVMAETLELASDIDASRAKDAEKRARDKLQGGGLTPDSAEKFRLKLERALIRQRISQQSQR